MRRNPGTLALLLVASLAACVEDETPVAPPLTVPLVTVDGARVGAVTVSNSTDGLFITAAADSGWELKETRLAVATSLAGLPMTRKGEPNLGRFVLRKKGRPAVPEMRFVLPLAVEPGTELFIALHAEVRPVKEKGKVKATDDDDDGDDNDDDDEDCDEKGKTSAWAQGFPFPGDERAMYLTYTVRAAAPPTLTGMFRTHSQEEWGAAPQAGNAASYLTANFAAAFPGGLTVGDAGGFTLRFTSGRAVIDLLPQAGIPGPLTRNEADPRDLRNPLAGSTTALALNLGFDDFDPAFSASTLSLGDLVVADPASPLFGLSVRDVFSMANQTLAGLANPVGLTAVELHDAATRINSNFEGGLANGGFLGLR